VLIAAMLFYVKPHELAHIFYDLDLLQVIALFAVSFLLIFVSCIKWKLFLTEAGVKAQIWELFRLYVIGYFVNLFAPSTLGGDALRSFEVGRRHGAQAVAFSATFFERFTGILAMAMLSIVFLYTGSDAAREFAIPILLFGVLVAPLGIASFTDWGFTLFDAVSRRALLLIKGSRVEARLHRILDKIEATLSYARGKKSLFIKSILVSFLFHALAILNTKLAANAVGWSEASVLELFIVVPLVLILSAVPITPSGIGIQEGAFIYFLQKIGATAPEAAGVALLLRAKTLALGLVGGVLLLLQRSKEKPGKEKSV